MSPLTPEPLAAKERVMEKSLKNSVPVIHEIENGKYVGVIPGKSIRLHGVEKNRYVKDPVTGKRVPGEVHYDVTYNVGDEAEYDSYNWSYIGRIVSIGAKTVTIEPRPGEKKTRLKLAEFSRRNAIGTVAEKRARASEEMMYH